MKTIIKVFSLIAFLPIMCLNIYAQEIFEAVRSGNLEKVKEIVETDPQAVNTKMNNRISLLFYTADQNQTEIAEYLLSKGAEADDVLLDDYYGITPMTNAIVNGNLEMAKVLQKGGADVYYRTKLGVNYLHYAAAKNRVEIAEYLLECGIDINSVNMGGLTPLHIAAVYGSLDAARLLIKKGADFNLKSDDGGTVLHFAIAARNNEIADLLRQSGAEDMPREFTVYKGKHLGQKTPGSEPEPFLHELFRDIYRSYGIPIFSPDGKEVFWYAYFLPRTGYGRIWWMREKNGTWTPPELAPFSYFDQFSPGMSPNGNRLYFASSNPTEGKKTNDADLWYVEKHPDGNWSQPMHLGSPPNREGFGEMLPLPAADGTIYFKAFGPDTRGTRMFKSKYTDGKYGNPQSLDDFIDSGNQDDCMDMKYIITYTYGGPRHAEVTICFHESDGRWTKPIYMGEKIHQGQGTSSANISPDGKFLFFVQNISPYWIDISFIEELRPKE